MLKFCLRFGFFKNNKQKVGDARLHAFAYPLFFYYRSCAKRRVRIRAISYETKKRSRIED